MEYRRLTWLHPTVTAGLKKITGSRPKSDTRSTTGARAKKGSGAQCRAGGGKPRCWMELEAGAPHTPLGLCPFGSWGCVGTQFHRLRGQPVPARCLAAVTFLTFQHHSLRSSLSSLPTVLSAGTTAQKPASPRRMTSSYKNCTCMRKEVGKHLVLTRLAVLTARPFCKRHLHKA